MNKILLFMLVLLAGIRGGYAAIGTTSARYHPDQFKASVNVSQGVYTGSDATNSLPNVMRLAKAIGFWNVGIWQRGRRDVAFNESTYWNSPYVNGPKFHIYNPWEYSRFIYGAGCPDGTDLIPNEVADYGHPTAGENLGGNAFGIAGMAFQQRYSQKQRQWILNHAMWQTSTDPGTSTAFGSFPQAYRDAFVYGYGTRGVNRDIMWNVQNKKVCEDLTDGLVKVIDAWQAGTVTNFTFGGVGFDLPTLNGYMYTPENGSGMVIRSINQYPHPSTDCAYTPPATQNYTNYQGNYTCVEWVLNHAMWQTTTDPATSTMFGSFPQAYSNAFVYGYGTRGVNRDIMWNVQNKQVCEDLTDGLIAVVDAWQAGTGTDFTFGGVGFDLPTLNGYMYTPENGSGMAIRSINQYPHPSTDCAYTPPATQSYTNYQGNYTCVETIYRTMDFSTVPEGMCYLYQRMRQKLNNKYGTGTWSFWGDAAILYGYGAFVTDSNYTDEYLARASQMPSEYWPYITPDIMYQEAPHFGMQGGKFDDFCRNTDIWTHNVRLYDTQTGITNMDNWYPGTQSALVAKCGETGAWNSWALDFSRRTPSNDADMPLEFDNGTWTVRPVIVMPKVFVAWQNWLDVPFANRKVVYGTETTGGITTRKATYSASDDKSTFYIEVFNGFPNNDSLWIATHPDKIQLIDNNRLYKRQLYVVIAGSGTVNNWSATGCVTIHNNEVVDDIRKVNLWWEDTNVSSTGDWTNFGKSYKPTAAYNSYGTGYIFFLRTLAFYPQTVESAGKTVKTKSSAGKTAMSKFVSFE